MNKCSAIKSDNTKCKANRMRKSEFCFRHGSSTIVQQLASSKGGQNRRLQAVYGQDIILKTPEDVKSFLGIVINAVWTGQIPVPVGSSMGFLTRCWLDAHEAGDVERKLEKFEKLVEKMNL